MPFTIAGSITQRSGTTITGHIVDSSGADVVQADLLSITYTVLDAQDQADPVPLDGFVDIGLDPSDVIFDTLQNVATLQVRPFNFKHVLPALALPNGGQRYFVRYVLTPVSGEQYVQMVTLDAVNAFF